MALRRRHTGCSRSSLSGQISVVLGVMGRLTDLDCLRRED